MVPNVLALLMLAALPAHGNDDRRYAARTGRFLPGLGRMRA